MLRHTYFLTGKVANDCGGKGPVVVEASSEWSGDPCPGRTPSAYRNTKFIVINFIPDR